MLLSEEEINELKWNFAQLHELIDIAGWPHGGSMINRLLEIERFLDLNLKWHEKIEGNYELKYLDPEARQYNRDSFEYLHGDEDGGYEKMNLRTKQILKRMFRNV